MLSVKMALDAAPWTVLLGLRRALSWLQGPVLAAVAYFLGAEAAFYIGTLSDKIFALFWPPNVILFCALLIVPRGKWWLYIAAAFPAHVIAELGVGMPAPQLLLAFATNCMVALLDAYAVRRFVGDPPWFGTWQKISIYIIITAGIVPAVASLAGAFVPILGGGSFADYGIFWSHWYLANSLPSITLGPAFMIWFSGGTEWQRRRPLRRNLEPVTVLAILVSICILAAALAREVAGSSLVLAVLLLPLPFVLWAAIRFGEKGASAAIAIVAVILTWRSLRGAGLFPLESPERSVLALQLFLTGLSIPVLLLGALIDDLRRTERTTRDLAASLVRAQDEERRRIARDLHDSTGQNLIAATLIAGRLEKVLPESAQSSFHELEDMLQQSIREVRTVSYLLHPPLLDEAGLGPALRHFVEGFMERSEIVVDLEVSPDLKRLPADTELALFRVVQEALTNISRHSDSATAVIRLAREGTRHDEKAVLMIADAGKGMPDVGGTRRPAGGPNTGVGLASMRERINQLGGRLDIASTVGRTVLTATVPLQT